jgi:hypothetical protein
MAEGISPNPLNKISQVYLDRIAKINSDPEIAQKEREKWQTEAKVDTGSAEEKATARNKRNTPAGKDYDFDNKVFITRKPGESLESARTRKRRDAHTAKRGVKEGFSTWRNDLREIVDEIESEAEKKVKEKNVKNKVVINPVLTDAVEQMGGQLLEVAEVEDKKEDDNQKAEALKKKEAMLKKRIVRMKMQAVNQGAGENIIASYDPLENAVEYFYEEGINEEGIDILIEEIGLDDFVDFVDGGGAIDLNEERAARRANVKAKSYAQVKKEVDTSDAARKKSKKGEYSAAYKKKETDVTVYDDKPAAKKKAPAKKPAAKKVVKPVAKKVERAVTKVKKSQPKKEVSKKGIRGAIERGVARHKKAVGDAKAAYKKQRAKGKVPEQRAKEFGKGVVSGVKTAVKVAKDVKKVVSEKLDYDPMDDPDFDHDEAEKNRGVSGKNNPKGGKKLKDILKKSVKEEVGISSTEKMAAARKEAKLKAKEAAAVKKAKSDKQKALARKKSVSAKKQLSSTELAKYDTDNDGKVRVVNASFSNWKKELIEKDLNAAERRALPDKDFALPGKGKGPEGKQAGSYPIPDKNHARMALAMVAKHGTPEKKEKVRAAVAKKFPGIQQEDYDSQKKKEVLDAMKRQGRKLSDKEKEKIAAKVVKDKGDTSKSDDRYAYESLQQEGLVGAKVDSQKEVNRATRKAAFRPFKNTTPPKLKVAEDKAFDNVVGALRKKYGKDAVLTKDSPRPKPQPRPKAKPDTRTPEQKKKDQDHANVMARYGGEDNYKAGRGLGT